MTLKLANMGLLDLKKELKKLDKDKLVDLIADLYKKNFCRPLVTSISQKKCN